jgi:hypothetical protein
MKLPKRNIALQEIINKTDEESHTIIGPIDKSADSDAVADDTVVVAENSNEAVSSPAMSQRDRAIAEAYQESQNKKAEDGTETSSDTTEAAANAEPVSENSTPAKDGTETPAEDKPEEEIDENDKLYLACFKAAGDYGYTGEAQKLRAKELFHTQKNEQAKAEQSAKAAERMQQSGGAGAPGITGLISKMFSKSGNSGKLAKEGLAERVLKHRANQLNTNFHNMSESIKDLDREVGVLNETFGKSLGGGALAEIAKENNISVSELISNIESGENKSVQARLALDNAMSNPEYNAQWKKVTETRQKMTDAVEATSASFEKLQKSHGDRFDSEGFSKKLVGELDAANKGNKPIAGTTEDKDLAKDFQKHLDDMMEKMRKVISRAIDKVVQIFAK